MGLSYIANRIWRRPVPTKNAWRKTGAYLCDEVGDVLTLYFPQIKDADLSMLTPDQVLALFKSSPPVYPEDHVVAAVTGSNP
jgi:hypothetical protein